MDRLSQDMRYGLRQLRRAPGFAAVAVATLALGIGATTAVFTLVQAVLVRPLPFRDPSRLVMVWENNLQRGRPRNVVNPSNYLVWQERNHVFESIAGLAPTTATLGGEGEPVRVTAGYATANLFSTLGVDAVRGRAFLPEDAAPGATRVAVLSEGLWKRRFGGEASVLGRTVRVNGRPATVVGVMPARVDVPPGAEVWVPIPADESLRAARGRWMATVARLKPGVSLGQARAEMETIAAALAAAKPDMNAGWSVTVAPLHSDLVLRVRPVLLALMAAAGLLLLIACANVATLLLARASARRREIAVRAALGAGRGRVARQLLVESLVLALLGGGLGLGVARLLVEVLASVLPAEVPAFMALRLDAPVLAFAFAACLLTCLLVGLGPALRLSRPSVADDLKDGAAAGPGRDRRAFARMLVTTQVALALALLAAAGLLARSHGRLLRVDAGFEPRAVLGLQVSLQSEAYQEPARRARFFGEAVAALRDLPGVSSAAAISWRPLSVGSATSFTLADRRPPPLGEEPVADVRIVTPGLFSTLGVPLRQGRDFSPDDQASRPPVVIVNEALVREFWARESPLGKRIRMEWGRPLEAEVVGVVGDVRLTSLDTPARATLYWPVDQVPNGFMTLLLRTAGPPVALAGPARDVVRRLDPDLAVHDVQPLADVAARSLDRSSFVFVFVAVFATAAVALTGIGLFGVVAQVVGQRRPEFAVRMALGAGRAQVLRLVLGEGLAVAAVGALLGLLLALASGRLLSGLLFEVRPADPAVLGAACLFVLAGALAASYLPARRAARTDPAAVLHSE
jgi:putative ABC transport system permease protein